MSEKGRMLQLSVIEEREKAYKLLVETKEWYATDPRQANLFESQTTDGESESASICETGYHPIWIPKSAILAQGKTQIELAEWLVRLKEKELTDSVRQKNPMLEQLEIVR